MKRVSGCINKFKQDYKDWLFRFIFLALCSILLVTVLEYINRASLSSYFSWIGVKFLHFSYSVVFAFVLLTFFWALINRFYIAFTLTTLIYLTFCVISFYKYAHLGAPFIPSDILLFNPSFASLLPDLHISYFDLFMLWWIYPLLLALGLVVYFSVIYRKKLLLKNMERIVMGGAAVVIITVLCFIPKPANMNVKPYYLYQQNGLTLGFLQSAKSLGDFGGKVIEFDEQDLREQIAKYSETDGNSTNKDKPNVIAILSESFWDVTQLPDIEISSDPIPNFRALSEQFTSGKLISPTYGGVTSNVEFEFLTGLTCKYFPAEANVYTTFLKGETPSLASYFKSLGYECTGIHSYKKKFFNRDKVYQLFGFDEFLGENDFEDPEIKGNFISDRELAKKIIDQFESSDEPQFIFSVSMQNHMPYFLPDYYPDNKFKVESDLLDEDDIYRLQNYCQGISDADACLKMLVDYFSKVEEPTIILFFGDHLPALDENAAIYKKLGFIEDSYLIFNDTNNITDSVLEDCSKLLTTSYVMWNNFGQEKLEPETMSVNFLSTYLIDCLDSEKPEFNRFLSGMYKKTPVIGHYFTMDSEGKMYSDVPQEYAKYEEIYRIVQNDIVFGKKKLLDLFYLD